MSLTGKVALVTGAGGGIGRASAIALSEEGARVVVGYRGNEQGAKQTVELCEDAMAVNIDVSDTESVAAAFAEIENSAGAVEILVNNAGINKDGLLMRMSEQSWDEVMNTTLKGAFRCSKRALPGMLKARFGRIISIGSIVGTTGNPGQANYSAAKAALVGFSKSLALEVAAKGITVNVIAPGFIATDMTAKLTPAQQEVLAGRIPMGRTGTPAEVAETVRFCARASYLTGQVIGINGGLV